MSMNINVAVRIRPLNKKEIKRGDTKPWRYDNSSIYQFDEEQNKPIGNQYFFDRVYSEYETSFDIYNHTAKNIVMSSLEGINGTIFAYGQTASGKTFTMRGTDEHPGIIQLAINDIFDHIKKSVNREYLVKVSYLEIYNEVITDLLNPDNTKLKIHETSDRGIFVGGAKEEVVVNAKEMMSLLKKGDLNRKVGQTNMSEKSSRSHSIFRIVITSRSIETPNDLMKSQKGKRRSSSSVVGSLKVSLLNLVDLAGSERIAHTGAEGVRLKEGAHINKSLFTLERVINKLSDPKSMLGHIPFRDSKLTRILQTALGGNSKTAIICTITPSSLYVDESNMTLKFASCAKNIITRPVVNEIITDNSSIKLKYEKKIQSLKDEIAVLTTKLESNNDSGYEEREEELILLLDEVRRELEETKKELKAKKDEIKMKNKEIERIKRMKIIDDDLNDEEIKVSNELINELEEYNRNIQYLSLKNNIIKEKDEAMLLLKEKIQSLENIISNQREDMKKEKEISMHRLQEIKEIEKSLDLVNNELLTVKNEYEQYKNDMELKIDQIKLKYESKVKEMEDNMKREIQRNQMNISSVENYQKKMDEMKMMYNNQLNDIEMKNKEMLNKIMILEEEKKRLIEEKNKLDEESQKLNKEIDKYEEKMKEMEISLNNVMNDLEKEKNDHLITKECLLEANNKLKSIENEYDVLKFEMDIKMRSNKERNDKIKTLEDELSCLREEKEILIVKNKIAEEKLENMKIKQETIDLNSKLASYESMDIEYMKNKIEQYEIENNEYKKRIKENESKMNKMEEALENLQKYKSYAKQKKEESKILKDALDQMQRKNDVLIKQIERLRKENQFIKYGVNNNIKNRDTLSLIRDENHVNQS